MNARPQMANDTPPATSFPGGDVPLEAIVRTDELSRRPSRHPDYAAENKALVALSTALADLPAAILQTLADQVLKVLQADSAGLSLLTKDGKRFYWAAISGAWRPHAGGGTPRDFGPCGDVLDRNAPMLFTHWERRYPYLAAATPLADEGLLVPFYVKGKAVGTIWAIAHTDRRRFDAEDLRLLQSLGQFASAAYQAVETTEELKIEIAARKSERRYHEIRIDMAHANRVAVIGQMSASIAHEVNQPLSGILTNANTGFLMLARDPPDVDGASEVMLRTVRDANRAIAVIKRLHALFAKTDGPTGLIDLNDALRDVVALCLHELQRGNVILRSEAAADVPPVMGDRVQLQQVILNLVLNAVEAMSVVDDRPKELLIRTARTDSDDALLEVQDSGPGIDPANLERVFEAFYSTKPGGMGMGLSICRAIIGAHGGKLWASQGVPRGAVFQFTLPRTAEGAS
jgi:C4-dicarboxylate-specific signal transduction histidine kinase